MSAQNSAFSWQEDKLVLQIFLQPSTSQNEWYGRHDGRIRIRVTAPPVGNQAN
ncbi:MAG: YggU family protein, partial [Proteobacteria bacterium]